MGATGRTSLGACNSEIASNIFLLTTLQTQAFYARFHVEKVYAFNGFGDVAYIGKSLTLAHAP